MHQVKAVPGRNTCVAEAAIRLSFVASDIQGMAARATIKAMTKDWSRHEA